jgi:hypothetical protein
LDLPRGTAGKTPEKIGDFRRFSRVFPDFLPRLPGKGRRAGIFAGPFSAAKRGRVGICRVLSAEKHFIPSLPARDENRRFSFAV